MLRGKHGARLEFLRKRSLPNLPEDKPGVREDVVKDWNHIHETVRIVSKTLHHAIFYRWEILGCLKSLMWSEARFLQVQMAGIWGSWCQICANISFFSILNWLASSRTVLQHPLHNKLGLPVGGQFGDVHRFWDLPHYQGYQRQVHQHQVLIFTFYFLYILITILYFYIFY